MQFRLPPLAAVVALVVVLALPASRPVIGSPVDADDAADDDDDISTQIERPAEEEQVDHDFDDLETIDDLEDIDIEENFDYNDQDDEDEDEDEDGDGEDDEEDDDVDEPAEPVEYDVKDFDVDYNVKRPNNPEQEVKCDGSQIVGTCAPNQNQPKKNYKPYEAYKGYAKWERSPLFVIIIGGLRWDYLTPSHWNMTEKTVGNMKAFSWIRKHGATMQQVVPVFPPYDLPSWTSLATGLYPKNTGVTGDYMYDLKTRKLFSREDSLEGWWQRGEPIWSLAARNDRRVSVLNWHDCKLPDSVNLDQSDCKPFNTKSKMPTKKKLIQMFNQAFTKIHAHNYDLSIVYTDAVKKAALAYGPNSPEVMKTLADLDEVLQGRLSDIKNKKERANLKLNILLLSDYGLNGKEETTKLVLDDYLEMEHVQYIIQSGGSAVIVPYALKAGEIMEGVGHKPGVGSMLGVDAYVRDVNLEVPPLDRPTIPKELNYGGYTWTQDILLVAKPGFEIEIKNGDKKILPPLRETVMGTSGYNPDPPPPHIVPGRDKHKSKELRAREKVEGQLYNNFAHVMKTIGFAWGPDFKSGHVNEPIETVDIYQIMAFLLKVDPNPHDGEWDRVKSMFRLSSAGTAIPSVIAMLVSLTVVRLV